MALTGSANDPAFLSERGKKARAAQGDPLNMALKIAQEFPELTEQRRQMIRGLLLPVLREEEATHDEPRPRG